MLLLGVVPNCEWVQVRLGAYYGWDACLSMRALRAIERHLRECVPCATQWEEVRRVRDIVEQALAAGDPNRRNPERLVECVVMQFGAPNGRREAKRVARRVAWTSVSVAQVAAACLLIAAAPASAYMWTQVLRGARYAISASMDSGVVPSSAPVTESSPPKSASYEHLSSNEDLSVLNGEQVREAIIKTEVEALFPHTQEQYEAWARKEYPHIMWLYDILKEEFAWEGTWRQLLIDSGEIFRFDYPMSLDEPNCKPRIASVLVASRVAGFRGELETEGSFRLPNFEWDEKVLAPLALKLTQAFRERVSETTVETMPEDYVDVVARNRDLAIRILVYLSVTGEIISTPESNPLVEKSKMLLRFLYSERASSCNDDLARKQINEVFDAHREMVTAENSRRQSAKALGVSQN